MGRLIGYTRVSTKQQASGRKEADVRDCGVRRDDLGVDQGVAGARASRPAFEGALDTILDGDTFV